MRRLLSLFILLFAITAGATDYYISPSGSDAHGCTNAGADACLTPNHMNGILVADDILHFAGSAIPFNLPDIQAGVPWNVTVSGTPGHPITFTDNGGGGGIVTGFHIYQATGTWTEDTIRVFSGCPDDATCKPWYITVSGATFQNVESIYYKTPATTIFRRPRPAANRKNAIPQFGDSVMNVCGAGVVGGICQATQSQANIACGCPGAGIGGNNCASKAAPAVEPTPWYCGFIKFRFTAGDLGNNMHGENIGDVEIVPFEVWTVERMRLASVSGNIATLTGPTFGGSSNSGFIPGHNYIVDNELEAAAPGSWYLDRCPNNCPGNVPEANWRLYIFAAPGEAPNTDNVYVPQMNAATPQVLTVTGRHDLVFTNLSIEGDNWQVPALGFRDSTGIPLATGAVEFVNTNNVTWTGMQTFHCNGDCFSIKDDSNGYVITASTFYDCGATCGKVGRIAALTDTNTNVPRNIDIEQNEFAYNGMLQASGEGSNFWWGNGHNGTLLHNTFMGGFCGAIEIGSGLDVGVAGGSSTTAYFMYAIELGFNDISGRNVNNQLIGLLSDCGGVHMAFNHSSLCGNNPTDWCVTVHDNVIHEFGSNYSLQAYQGVTALYCDQGCSWLHAYNNMIYRMAFGGVFNNLPSNPNIGNAEATFAPQNNLYENNVFIGCGSAKYGNPRCVNLGGKNPNAFTMKHNIFIFNSNHAQKIQSKPSQWGCFDYDPLSPNYQQARPCTDMFVFDYNLYYDYAGKRPHFTTCAVMDCSSFTDYTDVPWAGEDVHSITNLNPGVVDPRTTLNNFFITNREAMDKIGFHMPDYTTFGRTNTTLVVPLISNPWPILTFYDEDADMLGSDIGATPLAQFWSTGASTSKVK